MSEEETPQRRAGENVGIMLPINQGLSQRDLVDVARHAEEVGLDAVCIGEYASADAFALAAAIAMVTERIRIETGVIATVTRAPALLAMGAATLDDLSGGRFVLGLGAGSPVVAQFHDQEFSRPLASVAEAVADVQAALRGERLEERRFELRMPVSGSVPIILSALNPGMLRLAAQHTQGVLLPLLCSPTLVAELAEFLRSEGAGSNGPFETLAIQHGASGVPGGDARAAVKREIAGYFLVPTYRRAALHLVGEAGLEAAAAAHRAGGMPAVVDWLPDDAVDQIFVEGEAGAFAARIKELDAIGCHGVRFNTLTPVKGDTAHARRLVEVLGEARQG